MIRRRIIANAPGTAPNNQTIIAPPPIVPGAPPVDCPTLPPFELWTDLTTVLPCAGDYPAEATISGGVFRAAVGADTETIYQWTIDLSGATDSYLCVVVPSAELPDQFRGFAIQTAVDGTVLSYFDNSVNPSYQDGEIISPYFLLRRIETDDVANINTYQRHTPDDPANGFTAESTFRILCIPLVPP